jgi:hypothetical protein
MPLRSSFLVATGALISFCSYPRLTILAGEPGLWELHVY